MKIVSQSLGSRPDHHPEEYQKCGITFIKRICSHISNQDISEAAIWNLQALIFSSCSWSCSLGLEVEQFSVKNPTQESQSHTGWKAEA